MTIIFRRSASSLASLHKFYGVEIVIFCEGGPSRTTSEALSVAADGRTLDSIFWETVLNFNGFTRKYHIKSVGSKSVLVSIANDISKMKMSNISVCVDSDYDRILSRSSANHRVAFTHGYSWESDIIFAEILERVLVFLIGPVSDATKRTLDDSIASIAEECVYWGEIDISLRRLNRPCIFDRDKPLRCVCLGTFPPSLDQSTLGRRLAELGYRRRPRRTVALSKDTSLRLMFGKLAGKLMYHLVTALARQVMPNARVDYDMFMKTAISVTFDYAARGALPEIAEHYRSQDAAFA